MLPTNPSILITDDDAGFRETLQGVLEPEGYRTLLASDGLEALDILQVHTIHVALFDMHMPRLDGLEAIRRLRQSRKLLPCILISGDTDQNLSAQAFHLQAFSVLSKPVSRVEVTQTVRSALRSW